MENTSFLTLKKNAKQDMSGLKEYKIVIIGDCSTQHLATALKGYGYQEGYHLNIFDSDYNQIDSQIMDDESELYKHNPDAVLIYMSTEKLYEKFCETALENRSNFADLTIEKIAQNWTVLNSKIKTNILQFNFVENDDCIFGNYGNKLQSSFIYQLRKLNFKLMELSAQTKNTFLIDLSNLQNCYGRQYIHDDKLYYIAKMPLSTAILPEVAKQILDVIKSLGGKFKKCAILDLDNTLWGGVIGDDGLKSIQIGELGLGHAFSEFQMWLKELKNRGIILAVCSKNNENIAKEPFEKHPEMILKLDDISMFVANWEDKASNILNIQKTLNIGMDSIVFIDDNPFERNSVKAMIPDITVPELPEDPALYLSYLKSLNLFETASYSENDKDRTKQYQAEVGRTTLQSNFENFNDYLKSLEMRAIVHPFEEFDFPRISQLSQRSNQFNLRTVRYTEAEVEQVTQDENYVTLSFSLKDKFGDYGLISLVIMEKQSEDTLFITNWLMSCRVLKRGMEEFIVNEIMETAKEKGFSKVIGEYIQTPKNAMVEKIYSKLGFQDLGNGTFEADVQNFKMNETNIQKERRKNSGK